MSRDTPYPEGLAAVNKMTDEEVDKVGEMMYYACLVVHPRNSHHPCGDCFTATLVLRVARDTAKRNPLDPR